MKYIKLFESSEYLNKDVLMDMIISDLEEHDFYKKFGFNYIDDLEFFDNFTQIDCDENGDINFEKRSHHTFLKTPLGVFKSKHAGLVLRSKHHHTDRNIYIKLIKLLNRKRFNQYGIDFSLFNFYGDTYIIFYLINKNKDRKKLESFLEHSKSDYFNIDFISDLVSSDIEDIRPRPMGIDISTSFKFYDMPIHYSTNLRGYIKKKSINYYNRLIDITKIGRAKSNNTGYVLYIDKHNLDTYEHFIVIMKIFDSLNRERFNQYGIDFSYIEDGLHVSIIFYEMKN